MTDVLLYPGCAVPSKLPFVEAAARFVLQSLDIPHSDFPDFTCCVEPVGLRSIGLDTWLVAGARLHAIAGKNGNPVLTLCDGCTLSMRESGEMLDSGAAEAANDILKEIRLEYSRPAEVRGFLETIHSRLKDLEARAVKPMELRLGVHPGCHADHLCNGKGAQAMLAEIIETMGGIAVCAAERVCCGGSLTSVNDEVARGVSQEALQAYGDADAIVTSCPFCFLQFDTVVRGKKVIHVAELVAEWLGWETDYMSHHRTRD